MKVTALVASVLFALSGALLAGCGQEGTGGSTGSSASGGSSSGSSGNAGRSPSGSQDPAKRSTSPSGTTK